MTQEQFERSAKRLADHSFYGVLSDPNEYVDITYKLGYVKAPESKSIIHTSKIDVEKSVLFLLRREFERENNDSEITFEEWIDENKLYQNE